MVGNASVKSGTAIPLLGSGIARKQSQYEGNQSRWNVNASAKSNTTTALIQSITVIEQSPYGGKWHYISTNTNGDSR